MDVLTIIVLLVLLLFTLNGYRRGFVKTLVSMVFFVLAMVLVYFATPYISDFLKEKTPVYTTIEAKCEEMLGLDKLMGAAAGNEDKADNDNKEKKDSETEKVPETEDIIGDILNNIQSGDISVTDQMKLIENLGIPQLLQKQLLDNNNAAGYAKVAADNFKGYIVGYLSSLILNIISFIVASILVFILLKLTGMTLDILTRLPIIHGLNQVMGLVLGFLQGLIFIWIAFLIITIFSGTDIGHKLMVMINESDILSFIYNTNYLMKILMGLAASF